MATGIDVLDRTEQETLLWLNAIEDRLGVADRREAFNALRATLHAVRDRIGADNALQLAAQLPLLVKGVFFERWEPSETPTREREKETFLENLSANIIGGLRVDAEAAARAVLEVMAERIEPSQLEKVKRLFPEEMRDLFPQAARRRAPPRRSGERPASRAH